MKSSQTPFYDAIAALLPRGPRFFVPGHKGNKAAIPVLGDAVYWDLTEVDGAGDLSCPRGPLAQSEGNMARAFGAGATLYSAFGSTSCIQAMLGLFCAPGEMVVMARGCHVSALRALAFLDLVPRWVLPRNGGVPHAADIDTALAQSGANAVYITSVDYHGNMPDVAAIAAVCHARGAALLCDNAQGAHLAFLSPCRHPLALGADAVCDSAHKTLPALTPAALLHLADAQKAADARRMLNLFSSTSPAYPVLVSLDLCAGQLLQGGLDFAACAQQVADVHAAAGTVAAPCDDPLRLVLAPAQAGYDAQEFYDLLLAQGLAPEYFDGQRIVFMASPGNTAEDFARLSAAVACACKKLPAQGGAAVPSGGLALSALPVAACVPRAALFSSRETLPVSAAAGRVMAGLFAPCPPGVPLVVPGEVLCAEALEKLAAGGISHVDVLK